MSKKYEKTISASENLNIRTTRFGELKTAPERVIKLEKPVLGFENYRRFVLVESEEMAPFIWLQAVDEPELAFLMINPVLFFADYGIEVNPKEVEDIGVVDGSEVETYVIVTAPGDPSQMTANLQGPIVINTYTKQAKQLVMTNSRYSVREPLFSAEALRRSSEKASAQKEAVTI